MLRSSFRHLVSASFGLSTRNEEMFFCFAGWCGLVVGGLHREADFASSGLLGGVCKYLKELTLTERLNIVSFLA